MTDATIRLLIQAGLCVVGFSAGAAAIELKYFLADRQLRACMATGAPLQFIERPDRLEFVCRPWATPPAEIHQSPPVGAGGTMTYDAPTNQSAATSGAP